MILRFREYAILDREPQEDFVGIVVGYPDAFFEIVKMD
jgi:hypothetical protein